MGSPGRDPLVRSKESFRGNLFEWYTHSRGSVRILRELRLELSAMAFFAGIVLTMFVLDRYALGGASGTILPGFLKDVDRWIGEWMVWITVVGPILLLSGGWYFVDTIRKRREFDRLIDIDSKAKFVRNQDRIEFLAWLLGTGYHRRAEAKKVEFNLK